MLCRPVVSPPTTQGAGLLGVYGCALLREKGFEEVFCCDPNTARHPFVSQFGAQPLSSAAGMVLASRQSATRAVCSTAEMNTRVLLSLWEAV